MNEESQKNIIMIIAVKIKSGIQAVGGVKVTIPLAFEENRVRIQAAKQSQVKTLAVNEKQAKIPLVVDEK
jgi:hypothetical protein